jgi:hypothetical protein
MSAGIIMFASILLTSCIKETMESQSATPKGSLKTDASSVLPIYMGQNTLIGEAFITIENEQIIVSVSLDEGYMPSEAHLYAGENPPPSSAPGQFPYHWYAGEPFPIVFTVDISEWYECQAFSWYFALHLAVGNETAWILPEGGINWLNKKGKPIGWGQYFLHDFEACVRER